MATDTLFGNRLKSASELHEDTLVNWFTHGGTLWYWLLASTTSDTDSFYQLATRLIPHFHFTRNAPPLARYLDQSHSERSFKRGFFAEKRSMPPFLGVDHLINNKLWYAIIRGVLTYPCKRRNLEWPCIPIVVPFQDELVLKPGGWRSGFCIARHEPNNLFRYEN